MLAVEKLKCVLTAPGNLLSNGRVKKGLVKQVSRRTASIWLRLARRSNAAVLRLSAGHYSILPLGMRHGYKLRTR